MGWWLGVSPKRFSRSHHPTLLGKSPSKIIVASKASLSNTVVSPWGRIKGDLNETH
jgi:hypothetical protein